MANDNNTALPNLQIGSFNCNGLANPKKRELVLNWLKAKREDIILLQESHTTPDTEAHWRSIWDGDIIFNHGQSNSTGVTILFKSRNRDIKIVNHKSIVPTGSRDSSRNRN